MPIHVGEEIGMIEIRAAVEEKDRLSVADLTVEERPIFDRGVPLARSGFSHDGPP
jgi:hypothetical protein